MNDSCLAGAFCLSDTCKGLLVKRGANMVENSNGNGRVVECTECERQDGLSTRQGSTAIYNSSMAVYSISLYGPGKNFWIRLLK